MRVRSAMMSAAAALLALSPGFPSVAETAGEVAPVPFERCITEQARTLGFSGVIAVARPQGSIVQAWGSINGAGTRKIGPDTRFNLASAGKMFTAVAVAQLIDERKVGLDDRIGRYVPGLTPEATGATVRQLLSHTSGLGNFFSPENLPTISRARSVSELLPLVAAEKPAFTPGSRFAYSNTGFLLLGSLIEHASGQSYGEYLRAHIFAPASMTESGLEPGEPATRAAGVTAMPALTGPQRSDAPQLRLGPEHPAQGPLRSAPEAALRGNPAGGAYSTANDLQRFFAALAGGRLISATMLDQLTSPQTVRNPADPGSSRPEHGLGFGTGIFEGHRWFGHNGGAPGINVETSYFPEDRTTVIVMANRDPPIATAFFWEIRADVFDGSPRTACETG